MRNGFPRELGISSLEISWTRASEQSGPVVRTRLQEIARICGNDPEAGAKPPSLVKQARCMAREVVLVDHDPLWAEMAEIEAERILRALGPEIVAIHHIGSTAIPRIKAKPVLDFLVYVRDLDALEARSDRLAAIGYVGRGEFSIPGRRYFTRDTEGNRSHQLHCFTDGDPEGERHRLFRDYLRAHPAEAKSYERLKIRLAARFRSDTQAYADAKTDYIRRIERKAARWRAKVGPEG